MKYYVILDIIKGEYINILPGSRYYKNKLLWFETKEDAEIYKNCFDNDYEYEVIEIEATQDDNRFSNITAKPDYLTTLMDVTENGVTFTKQYTIF